MMEKNNLLISTLTLCEDLHIDLLNKEQIQILIDSGLIIVPNNIFNLKRFKPLLGIFLDIPDNEVDNILQSIEIGKKCSLESFLRILRIPMLSNNNVRLIAKFCGDFKGFKKAVHNRYDFSNLIGICSDLNEDIYAWLNIIDWEDLGNKLIIEN